MTTESISFHKMHGSGNDFVLIDNRNLKLAESEMSRWARAICKRSFGIGSDGLIFLDDPKPGMCGVDYIWHFFNADGSRAEMCGNGSRCAAFLAHELGMAPREHVLGTDAGPISARVLPAKGQVRVQLTPLTDLSLSQEIKLGNEGELVLHSANTGVPHAVIITDHVEKIDVPSLGSAVRYHSIFAPAGANVNFVEVRDSSSILLRTYERGVEGETYACGTGAAASVAVANALGKTGSHVHVTTSGGEHLEITLDGDQIFLQGNATLVYQGYFFPHALNLD
ncbi:MAG: diaminopimelate epimerase [Desulfovibrionales bacterium]